MLLATASWAACPAPAQAIRDASDDLVRYFLRDAELSLTEAVAGFGCTGPAAPSDLASFWLARAMIWSFLDDARAGQAFAAARAVDPTTWEPEFGAPARAQWEGATSPSGVGTLVLRGVVSTDWVVVDGAAHAGEDLVAGLHVLQVGQGDLARFARLIQIDSGTEVEVVVPEGSGAAPTMQLASATLFADLRAPITRTGSRYTDGDGDTLSWRLHVQPVAAADPVGRASLQLYRTNTSLQVATLTLGAGALYGTYLAGWDAIVGHNLDSTASVGLTALTSAVVAGSGLLEARWIHRRRALRQEVERAANRALVGNAP